nr:SoxR reducing system RseC family protein [Romboutsia hominis]
MQRHSACAACGKCVTSSESKDIVVEVDNNIGAKVGDRVKVNMDGVNVLKAAFLVYLTPLAGLLIGTIATYFILNSISMTSSIEVISFIVGITTMMIVFFILKKRDKNLERAESIYL